MNARHGLKVRSISLVGFTILYVIASFGVLWLVPANAAGIRGLLIRNLLFGSPVLIAAILLTAAILALFKRPAFNVVSVCFSLSILGLEFVFVWAVILPGAIVW